MTMRLPRKQRPCHTNYDVVEFPRAACCDSTVRISRVSPCGGCGLWCGSEGQFTGGWTTGLLLAENSMTHQGVTLLHTD
jgi:hypothetical protein